MLVELKSITRVKLMNEPIIEITDDQFKVLDQQKDEFSAKLFEFCAQQQKENGITDGVIMISACELIARLIKIQKTQSHHEILIQTVSSLIRNTVRREDGVFVK